MNIEEATLEELDVDEVELVSGGCAGTNDRPGGHVACDLPQK